MLCARAVVHPITLEAHLQLTTTPGRDIQVPQALVEVSLQQVALALGKNQVNCATNHLFTTQILLQMGRYIVGNLHVYT